MTKNFTLLALASLLAFTACSSDDDYTASVPANGETSIAINVNKPLTVYAGMNKGDTLRHATRATVVESGRDGLTGFRLFGFHRVSAANKQTKPKGFLGYEFGRDTWGNTDSSTVMAASQGIVYSKDSEGKWSTGGISAWPADVTASNDFYGIAIQGEAPDSMTYDGDGNPSNQTAKTVDFTGMGDSAAYMDYTVPTDVTEQKDLLISSVYNTYQEDNYGAIVLGFRHALANVTLQLRFNATENGVATGCGSTKIKTYVRSGYKYGIDYITLHNVYTKGRYNFSDSSWTPSGSPTDIKVTFSTPRILTAGASETSITFQDLITGSSSIMLVPQSITPADVTTSGFTTGTGSYIEIHGVCWDPATAYYTSGGSRVYGLQGSNNPFNFSNANNLRTMLAKGGIIFSRSATYGCTSVYFAFPDGFKFEYNKSYNIRLNIYNGRLSDGTLALTNEE